MKPFLIFAALSGLLGFVFALFPARGQELPPPPPGGDFHAPPPPDAVTVTQDLRPSKKSATKPAGYVWTVTQSNSSEQEATAKPVCHLLPWRWRVDMAHSAVCRRVDGDAMRGYGYDPVKYKGYCLIVLPSAKLRGGQYLFRAVHLYPP